MAMWDVDYVVVHTTNAVVALVVRRESPNWSSHLFHAQCLLELPSNASTLSIVMSVRRLILMICKRPSLIRSYARVLPTPESWQNLATLTVFVFIYFLLPSRRDAANEERDGRDVGFLIVETQPVELLQFRLLLIWNYDLFPDVSNGFLHAGIAQHIDAAFFQGVELLLNSVQCLISAYQS